MSLKCDRRCNNIEKAKCVAMHGSTAVVLSACSGALLPARQLHQLPLLTQHCNNLNKARTAGNQLMVTAAFLCNVGSGLQAIRPFSPHDSYQLLLQYPSKGPHCCQPSDDRCCHL